MNDPVGYDEKKKVATRDLELLIPPLLKAMGVQDGRQFKILDFGSGTGSTATKYLLPIAEETNSSILGVDISASMIEYAKEHYSNNRLSFTCEDFLSPQSKLEKCDFDYIFSFNVLHWIKDHRTGIARLYDILKPGGVFGFTIIKKYPQFPLYKAIAQDPLWESYKLDYGQFTPTWIESGENGEDCIRSSLIESNFKILEFSTRFHTYQFAKFLEFAESTYTLIPFLNIIPMEFHQNLKSSVISHLCKMYQLPETTETYEKPFLLEYELMVGVASK